MRAQQPLIPSFFPGADSGPLGSPPLFFWPS